MDNKAKATKLLGLRNDAGELVCPADVLDTTKAYTVHLFAEDGSYTPSAEEAKRAKGLLEELGMKVQVIPSAGKGGLALLTKRGVVIARFVESTTRPAKPQRVEVTPEKPAPGPEDTTAEMPEETKKQLGVDSAPAEDAQLPNLFKAQPEDKVQVESKTTVTTAKAKPKPKASKIPAKKKASPKKKASSKKRGK